MTKKEESPYYFPPEEEEIDPKVKLVKEYSLDPFDEWYVETFLKVGPYLRCDYLRFLEHPQWVIDYISADIDRRYQTNVSGGEKPEPINEFHAALILALGKLFGGDKKTGGAKKKR